MNEKFDDRPLDVIAKDMVEWCKWKRSCHVISASKGETWLTCPNDSCPSLQKGARHQAFSIDDHTADFNCFHCDLKGRGLCGSNGLKAKLGLSDFFLSASPTASVPTLPKSHLPKSQQLDITEVSDKMLMTSLAFAPYKGKWTEGVTAYLDKRSIPIEYAKDAKAFCLKKGESFPLLEKPLMSDAICFPAFDANGDVIYCHIRFIEGGYKYDYGKKTLFVTSEAPETNGIIVITEAIFNAQSVRVAGYQAVALLGMELLDQYDKSIFKDKIVVVALDGDAEQKKAGATDAIVSKLTGVAQNILVANMPNEDTENGEHIKDPNDVLVYCGKEKLTELVDQAIKPEEKNRDKLDAVVKPPEKAGSTMSKESIVVGEPVRELRGEVSGFPETAWRGMFGWYRDAQRGTTEAPEQYHFAVLKTVAGVTLGRSAWVWCGGQLFPVFYTVLEGPSTQARKTTAANRGAELLGKVDPLVLQLNGLATAEGLLEQMRELTQEELDDGKVSEEAKKRTQSTTPFEGYRCLVILNEFATLLKKAAQESSSSIIPQLTQLYDCRPSVQNPTRINPINVRMPVLGIIGLTTKVWLEGNLKIDDVFGGFWNRFMFYRWTPTFPIPRPPEPKIAIINDTVKTLREIRERRKLKQTEFTFDDDASKMLDEWYTERWYRKYPSELDAVIVKRIDENVRKLALLYAVLENASDDSRIHSAQLRAAIDVGNWWEGSALSLFGIFGMSKQAQLERKILDILRGGSVSRRDLQRRLSMGLQELSVILNPLVKNGDVKVVSRGRSQILELSEP